MATISSRVKIKKDTESNWKTKNPVLLDGEVAIVVTTNDIKYKVGNGTDHFVDLKYVFETEIVTTNLKANNIVQGYQSTATGNYSVSTGITCYADNTCSEAKGIKARSKHDYAYVWNGNSDSTQNYESKEAGSYCIKPKTGINGFYIDGDNLPTIITNQVDAKVNAITALDSEKASTEEIANKLNAILAALKKQTT